ncbi:hypothetical protein ACWDLL_09890 [Streptomyces griseoincarnatus]|uniref:hypothetical protein n=1 Tax=unclassified Streptomyces TaxID=2593676 RepID=UPI000C880EB2|nr:MULTISPECIES: hypothetical protein [unclassified Streptomyces]MBJ6642240.1 hypothetical protein [Streptomyces sp. BSE7-9]MCA2202194.1 hypothetical protein [Streptomyces sp. SMS_SU21]NEA92322.1 hypothetical protein [Actinospica acidiphila]PWE10710.1 hypothetical protein DD630_31640 [Streptomyces sp. BSE7F]
MITEKTDKPRTRRPETGWARARRLRDQEPLRTCLPAVDRDPVPAAPAGWAEGNIVRGED